jgi:hypothetical protein
MRRTQLFGFGAILCLLFGSLIPVAGTKRVDPAHREALISSTVNACTNDSPNGCNLPVKYLGERDGCACFTCEYGKTTQRIICTADNDAKNTLIARTKSR